MKKIYYAAAALAVISLASCGKSDDKTADANDSIDVEVVEGQEQVTDLGQINDSTDLVEVTETVEGAVGTVPANAEDAASKAKETVNNAKDAAAKAKEAAAKAKDAVNTAKSAVDQAKSNK